MFNFFNFKVGKSWQCRLLGLNTKTSSKNNKVELFLGMLKGPALKYLYISAFQDRPNRGRLICLKICSKKVQNSQISVQYLDKPQAYTCQTYFTPPKEQSSYILISDQYCHHRSNNNIIIPSYVGPRI